jgi:UDP-N-acetylglucosamine transferase subunit ALG13
MVDEAAGRVGLSALMQAGTSSYVPRNADRLDYVGREEFDDLCRTSDYLVMHAGVGSVMASMRHGKLPIIVPRRGDLGEHINNHQFELATELSRLGWCRVAAGPDDLLDFLQAPPPPVPPGEDLKPAHAGARQRVHSLIHRRNRS